MKSFIIGGTSNLGEYISQKLENLGSEIITLSRSERGIHENSNHHQCDVLDVNKLTNILLKIKDQNDIIDNVWCVAGYAYPTKVENQSSEVMKRHLDRNFYYVKDSLEILEENIKRSDNPLVVTFGSQWSYQSPVECPELIPYAIAKNALMKFTQEYALSTPEIRTNHYCIPSSNTFAFRRIEKTLRGIRNRKMVVSHKNLAEPQIVALSLIDHALNFKESGKVLLIKPNGIIETLTTI